MHHTVMKVDHHHLYYASIKMKKLDAAVGSVESVAFEYYISAQNNFSNT